MEDTKLLTQIFSKNLIQQLARRDMAQNELAKQLGVSATAVNNWCKGHSMPRMDKIDKICAILRIQNHQIPPLNRLDFLLSALLLVEFQLKL